MKATFTVGSRLRFDDKNTSWLVRSQTADGRYYLATCSVFGRVYYTIIDVRENIRGAMNVIGQGLGIFTTKGPDPNIDEAINMLEESQAESDKYFAEHPENVGKVVYDGGWEVSHRNRVPLNITYTLNTVTEER